MICSKDCFGKLTQFSQGNNVRDAALSDRHGFLREIHVFLQLSRVRLFGDKEPISTLKLPYGHKYFFQKISQFSQGNRVPRW